MIEPHQIFTPDSHDEIIHVTPSDSLVGDIALRFPKVIETVPPVVTQRTTPWTQPLSGEFIGRQPSSLL